MAGDWIAMRCDLEEDPGTIAIGLALGINVFEVVGRLKKVWSWADQQSPDGKVSLPVGYVDEVARLPGFAAAMVAVGWLSATPKGLCFPNFGTWNTASGKRRLQDAKRKAVSRVLCPQNVRKMSASEADKNGRAVLSSSSSSSQEDQKTPDSQTDIRGGGPGVGETDEARRLRLARRLHLEGQYDPRVREVVEALKPLVRGTDAKRLEHYARLREPKLETARAWLACYERSGDRVGTVSDMCAYSHPDEVPPERVPETFEARAKRKSTEEVVRRAEARERERKNQ